MKPFVGEFDGLCSLRLLRSGLDLEALVKWTERQLDGKKGKRAS
jgi:hypothetical protein